MTDHTLPIPVSADHVTADWMTTLLPHIGFDVELASVHVAPIGTGQMATSLRVELNYSAQSSPDNAPASVVVKVASSDPRSRDAGARGAYLREVRFYQELNDELLVETPAAIWADIDTETNAFVLVLEDMTPARQGDQIAGCTVEQAVTAAHNIAGLHAPRWCDETLYDMPWLGAPAEQRQASIDEISAVVAMFTPGFIDRYEGRLTDRHVSLLNWFSDHVGDQLSTPGNCFGLTHSDHRLDNLLFNQDNAARPITVVDWQTIAIRNPVADISYLLGTGLEPDVRRHVERDVVQSYHQRLVDLGVTDYSVEQCFQDYRSQTPHALLLTVLGSMMTGQTSRGDDMFMAMLDRSSQQMLDLDVC